MPVRDRFEKLYPSLEPLRHQIQSLIKPFVCISRHPDEKVELWHSKFGSAPYLPLSMNYPVSDIGWPLDFVAQINFAEVPPFPDFPTQGILQFFMDSAPAGTLETRWFPEPALEDLTGEEDIALILKYAFQSAPPMHKHIRRPGRLQFTLDQAPPDPTDYHMQEIFDDSNWTEAAYIPYGKLVQYALEHKLGGYGRFVQGDPRVSYWADTPGKDMVPLLQIFSDEKEFGIMWGDMQELCFFILPEDLAQQNFSRMWPYLNP